MHNLLTGRYRFRPDAVAALYDDLGPPCTQCGRRFKTDEEGRRKKTAHMDWHFKVHQRSTEAEKRGTHRSWYVDQQVSFTLFSNLESLRDMDANSIRRTGSRLAKRSMRYMTCPPKKSLLKHPRTRKGPSTFSCPIQAAASTPCVRFARRGSKTNGSTRCRSGCGSTRSWWATEHIMPRVAPRRRGTETLRLVCHGARPSRCWGSGKQRRVWRRPRCEYRRRMCNGMDGALCVFLSSFLFRRD